MFGSNSSPFPHEQFGQSKQVKFMFNSSPPQQESPPRPQTYQPSKLQKATQPPLKKQNKPSPPKVIPSHNTPVGRENAIKHSSSMKNLDPMRDAATNQNGSNPFSNSLSSSGGGVRLQDLCPEDKQKIGELIKKLAAEKEEKEKLKKELETREGHYKNVIENLSKENEEIVKDSLELQNEFKSSLNLLKSFKDVTTKQQHQQQQKPKKEKFKQGLNQEELYEDQNQIPQNLNRTPINKPLAHNELEYSSENFKQSHLRHGGSGLKESDLFSPEKQMTRPSKQVQPQKPEQMLLQERINQEVRSPAKAAIETLEKEQRTINEITKLKEDIEGLAYSFKKINFSPKSYELQDEKQKSQIPTRENKMPSPIKLMETFKLKESPDGRNFGRNVQEENYYLEQPRSNAFGQSPTRLKELSYSNIKKNSPLLPNNISKKYKDEATSSSDEDEVAIAQKWLNLRKQKIQQINKELEQDKQDYRKSAQEKGQKSDKKRQEARNKEEAYYQLLETERQRKQQILREQNDEIEEPYINIQSKWIKNSPSIREMNNNNKSPSARKVEEIGLKSQSFLKKSTSSASKTSNNPLSPTGVVNLNELNVNDLIQLKTILDEKIKQEKYSSNKKPNQVKSPSKNPFSAFSPKSHDSFGSGSYFGGQKNTLSPKMDTQFSSGSRSLTKAGRSGAKAVSPGMFEYENIIEDKQSFVKDRETRTESSLMKDYNTMTYTVTKPESSKVTESYKDTFEGMNSLKGTVNKNKEERNAEIDYDQLYEEKLKEFLKVRERMVKSNKINEKGIDIEEVLKNALLESRRSNNLAESKNVVSPHKFSFTNSPPSVRSVDKVEVPKLSERDLIASKGSFREDFVYEAQPAQNRKTVQETPYYPGEKLESRNKNYDYRPGGVSQKLFNAFSPNRKGQEAGEEVVQLADDFYDDGLFDLVDQIEKKDSNEMRFSNNRKYEQMYPSSTVNELNSITSRLKSSSNIDEEFNSLFDTVRSMLSPHDDTTTERIKTKLLKNYGKDTANVISKRSSDDDESVMLQSQILGYERRTSGLGSQPIQGRPSKTDSSVVETDVSLIAINRKIDDMKKKTKGRKF